MRLDEGIRAFSTFILAERGLSPATEYAYRRDLTGLGDFLDWPNVSDVQTEDLRRWIAEQHRRGLASMSLNRRVACLKSFWRWAQLTGRAPNNPASDLSLPKKPRRLPMPLTHDEMLRFFNTPVKPYPSRGRLVKVRRRRQLDFRFRAEPQGLYGGEVSDSLAQLNTISAVRYTSDG